MELAEEAAGADRRKWTGRELQCHFRRVALCDTGFDLSIGSMVSTEI